MRTANNLSHACVSHAWECAKCTRSVCTPEKCACNRWVCVQLPVAHTEVATTWVRHPLLKIKEQETHHSITILREYLQTSFKVLLTQTDTSADPCDTSPFFVFLTHDGWDNSSHEGEQNNQGNFVTLNVRHPYSLSCGPHYRDARMQRRPVQYPSSLHTGSVYYADYRVYDLHNLIKTTRSPTTVTAVLPYSRSWGREPVLIPDLGSALIPSQRTPRTTWRNGLPTMPTAAFLVAEGISPTTGPGREGKGKGSGLSACASARGTCNEVWWSPFPTNQQPPSQSLSPRLLSTSLLSTNR